MSLQQPYLPLPGKKAVPLAAASQRAHRHMIDRIAAALARRNRFTTRRPRQATILLPLLTSTPTPSLLLTRRAETLSSHKGQVAFPGGRTDDADNGPIDTALREAHEEIALPPAKVEILGITDRYRTTSGFQVTPVVGVIPPDLSFRPEPGEVEDIFEVPLDFLLDSANHLESHVEWQGRERHYYEIFWQDRRIWGATAAMIVNLARRFAWAA